MYIITSVDKDFYKNKNYSKLKKKKKNVISLTFTQITIVIFCIYTIHDYN